MMIAAPDRIELVRLALQSARDTESLLGEWLEREASLRVPDLAVLQAVEAGLDRLAPLADRLQRPVPVVIDTLGRLIEVGLLHPCHAGPAPRYHLSAAGDAMLTRARQLIHATLQSGRHRFSEDDVERARRVVKRYLHAVGAAV
jgi:hypothetical protein